MLIVAGDNVKDCHANIAVAAAAATGELNDLKIILNSIRLSALWAQLPTIRCRAVGSPAVSHSAKRGQTVSGHLPPSDICFHQLRLGFYG